MRGDSLPNSRVAMVRTAIIVNVITTLAFFAVLKFSGYVIVVKETETSSNASPPAASAVDIFDDAAVAVAVSVSERRYLSKRNTETESARDKLTPEQIKILQKQKKRRMRVEAQREAKTKRESYRIVCLAEDDITFLPEFLLDGKYAVTGSQIMMNGNVYPAEDILVGDNELIGNVPDPPDDGSMFTQRCMATKGFVSSSNETRIEEAMCEFTLCLDTERGCMFFRAGGPYKFNPDSTGRAPTVFAAIVGGTEKSAAMHGGAKIKTLVRSTKGDKGVVVTQLDLYYQKTPIREVPNPKPFNIEEAKAAPLDTFGCID